MIPCPQCGSQIADNATFCGVCGHASAASKAPAGKPGLGKMTMLGIASPLQQPTAPPPQAPPQQPGRSFSAAKTMLGMASPFQPPGAQPTPPAPAAPAPAPAPAAEPPPSAAPATAGAVPFGKGKTIVGMALPPEFASAAGLAPSAAPVAPAPAAPIPAPTPGNNKKTLLGVAPIIPNQAPPASMAPAPVAHGKGKTMIGMAAPSLPAAGGAAPTQRKTLIGVAFSNLVAPLSPTVTEPEYVEEFYDEVVPETGEVQRRVRMVAKPLPPLYKRPAFYVLLGAPLILLSGVAALFFLKRPAPVTAEARLDAEGNDVIHVSCESCPDGTKLAADGVTASEVAKGKADLKVSGRLKVGDNALSLKIDRPEHGRDETVALVVPVAYRFSPDLNPLQDATPVIRVDVEALPGATVSVQGKPLTLDAAGRGNARLEVQSELVALPLEQKVFTKEIPYTIALKGGSPESGKLSIRLGVVPLTVESPGSNLVTDQATFLMAGHTQKGAGITVSGAPVAVNPDGTFRQHLKIPGLGLAEVPLRASAHGMAPRLLSMKVKLVQSLQAEAKTLDASGRPGYAELQEKLADGKGTAVAWHGKVLSASAPGGNQTVAVVDVQTGCKQKQCRARLLIPGGGSLAAGDRLAVYGRLIGSVADQDAKLPDIEADFIVRQP